MGPHLHVGPACPVHVNPTPHPCGDPSPMAPSHPMPPCPVPHTWDSRASESRTSSMPQGVPHTQIPPCLHPMYSGSPAPHVPSACTHQNPTPSTPDPCAISSSTHAGIPVPPSPTRAPHLLPCRPTPHTRMPPTGCACSSVRSWGSMSFSVRSSSSSSARAWGPRHRQEDTSPPQVPGGQWRGCGMDVGGHRGVWGRSPPPRCRGGHHEALRAAGCRR